MDTRKLLKELKEVLEGELDANDFCFDAGELTSDFGNLYREVDMEDGISANVDFKAEGWRKVDRGSYDVPPSESGEITIYITKVEFFDAEAEPIGEASFEWPYSNENTITITF